MLTNVRDTSLETVQEIKLHINVKESVRDGNTEHSREGGDRWESRRGMREALRGMTLKSLEMAYAVRLIVEIVTWPWAIQNVRAIPVD